MQLTFGDDTIEELEKAQTPKQKKILNFLLGKVMAQSKTADPKLVRRILIEKLSILTYEETDDGSGPPPDSGG